MKNKKRTNSEMLGGLMSTPKVSIVIPVLNGGELFEKALKSVLGQSLKDLEVIIVDAGSTDGTLDVIAEQKNVDNRLVFVESDRKSMGYQYNLGILRARGEYIGFVEADDFVSCDMYEVLFKVASTSKADIIRADWYSVSAGKKVTRKVVADELYGNCLERVPFSAFVRVGELGHWSGIYRRKYLLDNRILFNETIGASYQDIGFYFLAYAAGGSAFFVNTPFYYYKKDNPNSSVHDDSKSWCYIDEFAYVRRELVYRNKIEEYGGVLAEYFFEKYIWALRKIKGDDQLRFLARFASDFKELHELSTLSFDKDEERAFLNELVTQNPTLLLESMKTRTKDYIRKISETEHLIVLGKTVAAKWFINLLKDQVKVFANINSEELVKYTEFRENSILIIAVKSESIRNEIEKIIIQNGFEKYLFLPLWLI